MDFSFDYSESQKRKKSRLNIFLFNWHLNQHKQKKTQQLPPPSITSMQLIHDDVIEKRELQWKMATFKSEYFYDEHVTLQHVDSSGLACSSKLPKLIACLKHPSYESEMKKNNIIFCLYSWKCTMCMRFI